MERPQTPEQPRWRQALRLWWSFSWRWPLLMMAFVVPIGILVRLTKPPPQEALRLLLWQETADSIAKWVAAPLAFLAQILVFRKLLRIDYKNFSVRAVERRPEGE